MTTRESNLSILRSAFKSRWPNEVWDDHTSECWRDAAERWLDEADWMVKDQPITQGEVDEFISGVYDVMI